MVGHEGRLSWLFHRGLGFEADFFVALVDLFPADEPHGRVEETLDPAHDQGQLQDAVRTPGWGEDVARHERKDLKHEAVVVEVALPKTIKEEPLVLGGSTGPGYKAGPFSPNKKVLII